MVSKPVVFFLVLLAAVVCNVGLGIATQGIPKPPDLWFGGYSAVQASQYIANLDSHGLTALRTAWYIDEVYPLVYIWAFAGLLYALFIKGFQLEAAHWWQVLLLIPISAVCDYAENWLLAPAIFGSCGNQYIALTFAGVATLLKWIYAFLAIALMLLGIVAHAVRRLRQ